MVTVESAVQIVTSLYMPALIPFIVLLMAVGLAERIMDVVKSAVLDNRRR